MLSDTRTKTELYKGNANPAESVTEITTSKGERAHERHKQTQKTYTEKIRGEETYLMMMVDVIGRSRGGSFEEVERILCSITVLWRFGEVGQAEIVAGRNGLQRGVLIKRKGRRRRRDRRVGRRRGRGARMKQFEERLVRGAFHF